MAFLQFSGFKGFWWKIQNHSDSFFSLCVFFFLFGCCCLFVFCFLSLGSLSLKKFCNFISFRCGSFLLFVVPLVLVRPFNLETHILQFSKMSVPSDDFLPITCFVCFWDIYWFGYWIFWNWSSDTQRMLPLIYISMFGGGKRGKFS